MDHLCVTCFRYACMHARLHIDALWSPAGKGLTSWLSIVMPNCKVGTLGQIWCWFVSIPDLCPFLTFTKLHFNV